MILRTGGFWPGYLWMVCLRCGGGGGYGGYGGNGDDSVRGDVSFFLHDIVYYFVSLYMCFFSKVFSICFV